jgi:YD repeat-containing protein
MEQEQQHSKINSGYKQTLTINDWGQAVSLADFGKEGTNINNAYGKIYRYGEIGGSKNKLTLESKLVSIKDMPNNLIKNGTFDSGLTNWTSSLFTANDKVAAVSGNNALKITGEAKKKKNVKQIVNVSGAKGDIYTISAWAKPNGISTNINQTKYAELSVGVYATDGTSSWSGYQIDVSSNEWQYASYEFTTPKAYNRIDVYLVYYNNANEVLYDNVGLFKEDFGQSYYYDAKGNLITNRDEVKNQTGFQYDGKDQLIKETNPKGGTFTYTYDTNIKNRILSATNSAGQKYTFGYNSFGQSTSSKIQNTINQNPYIETKAEYDDMGYLTTSINEEGNRVTSEYNQNTRTVKSVETPNGSKTNYSYDNMDRLTNVSKTDKNTNTSNRKKHTKLKNTNRGIST